MKTLLAPWCWICLVSTGLPGRIAAAECTTPPLDEEILPRLSIWLPTSAQAGREVAFHFGYVECCYVMLHATDCVGFSVAPDGSAEIDLPLPAQQEPRAEAKLGKLKLGSFLNHGDTVTLRADVEDGTRVVEATVHIYPPAGNPLVGRRHEVPQFQRAAFTRGYSIPECLAATDANAYGGIDIADPIHILSYPFSRPTAPSASPGPRSSCTRTTGGLTVPASGSRRIVASRGWQRTRGSRA